MLDSIGLELFGQDDWCAAKHGRGRRRWMKLHLDVDATTGEVVAHLLTDGHRRNATEIAIDRYKHLIGPTLRGRNAAAQAGKVALAVQVLNRMIHEANRSPYAGANQRRMGLALTQSAVRSVHQRPTKRDHLTGW